MNRKIILVRRPNGLPLEADFKLISEPLVTSLSIGEVLVKIEWTSVDPSQRVWISKPKTYFASISIGDVIPGYSIGIVVQSTVSSLKPGTNVLGLLGWQEYCCVDYKKLLKIPSVTRPSVYLGALGLPGISAYIAIADLAKPQGKEIVVVSSAAGTAGSIACQIAKIRGCVVVGIAGSDEKCDWLLNELKIDSAINYKKHNLARKIAEVCPDGIDIYIDNVGGEVLDAVLLNLKKYARIVMCGAISAYNYKKAPSVSNYPLIISMSATVIGFLVDDYKKHFLIALKSLGKWIKEDKIKYKEHMLYGLESAPLGLSMLLKGENNGKVIVKLSPPIEKI